MNLVCYGASVTAQKDNSGYFEQLKRNLQGGELEIQRLSFGASHFDYAGFAYCSMISALKPDIIIVDWLTPSMKSFSLSKIKFFHEYLKSLNVKVLWVNFPRKDDLNNERECYTQIKNSCAEFSFDFIDVLEECPEFKINPEKYLRDIVHTTESGAVLYATVLVEKIKALLIQQHKPSVTKFDVGDLPAIHKVEGVVEQSKGIKLDVFATRPELEILINCRIGPNIPYLKVSVLQNQLVESRVINPADAWCYYERNMVLPPIRFKLSPGRYRLLIEAESGEPLHEFELKKPIKKDLLADKKHTHVFNIVTF